MLRIENDGPRIRSTNFWESPENNAGLFVLSPNADFFRLLVPKGSESAIVEMRAVEQVVVSRGPWVAQGGRDSLELLFDDGSANPYAIHLDARQCVTLPVAQDAGKPWWFSAWVDRRGAPHLSLTLRCQYRIVDRIPCLKPWGA